MSATYSVRFDAVLSATAGTVTKGYAVTWNEFGTAYVVATTANLAASSSGVVEGILLQGGSGGQALPIQSDGRVPSDVVGSLIGTGNATDYVYIDTLGRPTRTTDGTNAIGRAGKDGSITLSNGAAAASIANGTGDWTGPSSGNTVVGLRGKPIASALATPGVGGTLGVGADGEWIERRRGLSPRLYDAAGDNATDDYLAFRRAHDAAHESDEASGYIELDPGTYVTSHPLRFKHSFTGLVGSSRVSPFGVLTGGACQLKTDDSWFGPMVWVCPVMPDRGAFAYTPSALGSTLTVTGATNATPIVVTTSGAHGLSTGQAVCITGVVGNTAANGSHRITVVSSTTFSLDDSVGNGAYTSGGTASTKRALKVSDSGSWWLDVTPALALWERVPFFGWQGLDGSSYFAIEVFFRVTTMAASPHFVCSHGATTRWEDRVSAFGLNFDGGGTLGGYVNLDGTTYSSARSAAITADGRLYHAAMVYDGDKLRLWVTDVSGIANGASTAMTLSGTTECPNGATVQRDNVERVTIGKRIASGLEDVDTSAGWAGTIEAVGIYTYARYGVGDSVTRGPLPDLPSNRSGTDANETKTVLLVHNFTPDPYDPDALSVASCWGGTSANIGGGGPGNGGPGGLKGSRVYTPIRFPAAPIGPVNANVEQIVLRGFSVFGHQRGGAIDLFMANHITVADLFTNECTFDVWGSNYCNFVLVEDITSYSGLSWVLAFPSVAIGECRNIHFKLPRRAAFFQAAMKCSDFFLDCGEDTPVGIVCDRGIYSFDKIIFGTEQAAAGSTQDFRALVLSDVTSVDMRASSFEIGQLAAGGYYPSPVEVQGTCGNTKFTACAFTVDDDTPAIVKVGPSYAESTINGRTTGKPSISFDACTQNGSGLAAEVPWVDRPAKVAYEVTPTQGGIAQMSAGDTSITVTLPWAEPDDDYNVVLGNETWWPSVSSVKLSTKTRTTASFVIESSAAIPAGKTVGVSWKLRRGHCRMGDTPPEQIPGSDFLLRADQATVSTWPDLVGTGAQAEKFAGSANVTLSTSADLNGEDVVVFNGTTTAMYVPGSQKTKIAANAYTFFAIFTDLTAANAGLFGETSSGGSIGGIINQASGFLKFKAPNPADDLTSTINAGDGNGHIVELVFDVPGNYISFRVDGETLLTGTVSQPGLNLAVPWGIGSYNDGSGKSAVKIAELLWVPRRLSASEIAAYRLFANTFYGVTV